MNKVTNFLKYNLLGAINKWAYQRKSFDPNSVSSWIEKYTRNRTLDAVQIGSNDGVSGDPLHTLFKKNTNWRVFFVEPVPYIFEKLKNNYGTENRFTFKNTAINNGEIQTFYWVSQKVQDFLPGLPTWHDQLGSFDKNNILKHLNGILEPYIVETKIRGMSLNELLLESKVKDLQILHIDAEGYDWKILSQLNLSIYLPRLILFEHKHLNEKEKTESISFLENKYLIFQFSGDFLCIERKILRKNDLKILKHRMFPKV